MSLRDVSANASLHSRRLLKDVLFSNLSQPLKKMDLINSFLNVMVIELLPIVNVQSMNFAYFVVPTLDKAQGFFKFIIIFQKVSISKQQLAQEFQ